MELENQLKELSFEMMKNEMSKMQIENSYYYSQRTGNTASGYSTKSDYNYGLLNADKKGYEISLRFNDLLLSNGRKFNNFENGPDAVNISAENLLNKYGLAYPISWYVIKQDEEGLHFGYNMSDAIDNDHNQFLTKIEKLVQEGKIDSDIQTRLIAAAEYYAAHHKLLSKHFNNEELNVDEPKMS